MILSATKFTETKLSWCWKLVLLAALCLLGGFFAYLDIALTPP
jgi:hypothetical protein